MRLAWKQSVNDDDRPLFVARKKIKNEKETNERKSGLDATPSRFSQIIKTKERVYLLRTTDLRYAQRTPPIAAEWKVYFCLNYEFTRNSLNHFFGFVCAIVEDNNEMLRRKW